MRFLPKLPKMRFRFVYMAVFTALIILASFLGDPDSKLIQDIPMGAGFIATVLVTLRAVVYVAILHVSRKGLLDYIDLETFFKKALETPLSSSIALVAVSIIMSVIGFLIYVAVR